MSDGKNAISASGFIGKLTLRNNHFSRKPVQRHIAYLGSIRKENSGNTDIGRYWNRCNQRNFWEGITKCLDELHIAGRKKIEAAIAKRVPRLTKREIDQIKSYRAALQAANFEPSAIKKRFWPD